MKFEVKPLEGINQIKFGMSALEVRIILGNKHTSIRTAVWSNNISDYYDDYGIRLTYDDEFSLDSIGLLSTANASIFDINLKTKDIKIVSNRIRDKGYPLAECDDALYNDELGFSVQIFSKKIQAYELYRGKYKEILEKNTKLIESYYSST